MVSLGLIFTGLAAVAGLIIVSRFGEPFGRGAVGIGSGLASLGAGLRSGVSRAASPTIRPIIDFSQVLPGLQAGLGAAGQAVQQGDFGGGGTEAADDSGTGSGGGGGAGSMAGIGIRGGGGDPSLEFRFDEGFN